MPTLLTRNMLALPVLVLCLAGCSPNPPALTTNLPGKFDEARKEFNLRISHKYPPGTLESTMLAELKAEGFSFHLQGDKANGFGQTVGNKEAVYETSRFPCRLIWSVRWSSAGEKIERIEGNYFGICL